MSARATSDVDAGTVRVEIDIHSSPERVFQALSDPAELASWWGSPETYRTFDWQIDLRPGGAWSCRARNVAGGEISTVNGEYRAVEPPRLLEYTWQASWEPPPATLVRIEIEPTTDGARVVLTHSGFVSAESCRGHAEGWSRVLAWLEKGLVPVNLEVSP
jgi:uncharacterized protein YndB with AHSA1/START domain